MNDLISRSALLAAYDKAHQGPPGGARKLIEEAPAVNGWGVWHVFHRDDDGRIYVDRGPDDGEDILLYRYSWGDYVVTQWSEDMYEEYSSTADGEDIEAGDAWMELPKEPH